MRRSVVWMLFAMGIAACTDYRNDDLGPDELEAPTDLSYQLVPRGYPESPDGILLRWIDPGDAAIEFFVFYSRGSSSAGWNRRAATTSTSFHDAGFPHLQYYVVSESSCRLYEAALGPLAMAFAGSTDKESIAAIRQLEAERGDGWRDAWLASRGLDLKDYGAR